MTFDYGIIGNCKTCALVKSNSSIEWLCFPRFDSPSVFAKLLDKAKGGSFEIRPVGQYKTEQKYFKNTNIIETVFSSRWHNFSVIDFFPIYIKKGKLLQSDILHRLIRVNKGKPKIMLVFNPKLAYAKGKTSLSKKGKLIVARHNKQKLYLYSTLPCEAIINSDIVEIKSNHFILLSPDKKQFQPEFVQRELDLTRRYWEDYVTNLNIPSGADKESVIRSILTLKLLTFHKSGAVIAAATTSIPEVIGKSRNWDYRYCWLRDASFTIDAFTKVCSFKEAEKFLEFLMKVCKPPFKLQSMYGVEGEKSLAEKTLRHLEGFKGSKPVRIGNNAFKQLQIDAIGEVLHSAYQYFVFHSYSEKLNDSLWKVLKQIVELAVRVWNEKDSSIWEFRKRKEHFVFSKMMSWVALDRGISLAKKFNKSCPLKKWQKVRKSIREQVLSRGFNEGTDSFVMYYGADCVDASLLLMLHYGFIKAKDPKFISTVRAVENTLVENGLVFRYRIKDDFGYPENPFLPASFWLVDALHAIGDKQKARRLFRSVMKCANHLNLFSEDYDLIRNQLCGNFPQAYTHMALINTAVGLAQKQKHACRKGQ